MRVLHVVPGTLDEASGVSNAVLGMCDSLSSMGIEVEVASLNIGEPGQQRPYIQVFPSVFGGRRLGVSGPMRRSLERRAGEGRVQVVHCHGLWRMPLVYAARAARLGDCSLLCSPHGTMAPLALAHHQWRKRLFWPVQRRALQQVRCFVGGSPTECADIRSVGFRQPVCILPHGVQLPGLERMQGPRRTLLYLGRIDELKGIGLLLRAWSAVEARFPEWDLLLAGPAREGAAERVYRSVSALGIARASLVGPLYGAAKWAAYQSADLFVMPSPSESFGLAVAEALAAGTPAIVSRGAPWGELEQHAAGWWINPDAATLASTLGVALALPRPILQRMGAAGRRWMERDFAWDGVAKKLLATYRWLQGGENERPAWVVGDS